MNNNDQINQLAETILATLEREKFARWYAGRFAEYVEGSGDPREKDAILEDIKGFFGLNK